MQQDDSRQSRFALDPLHRGAIPTLRERASSQPPGSLGDALSTRLELANRRYESAFGAPGTPPVAAASPWTPTRPSTLGMASATSGRAGTTRSLSFSTSQDLPARFHPFMPDTFPSPFEDDEDEIGSSTLGGEHGQAVYDTSYPMRGSRAALLAADGTSRSRSQSLAATSRRQVPFSTILPAPGSSAFTQTWGERVPSLGGTRHTTQTSSNIGGLGHSVAHRGLSSNGGTDLSNMSPFVRDVSQIYLDDHATFKDTWPMSGTMFKDDGGGSGTTSRRHSVSVIQPRRPIAVGFSVSGAQNDSPTFGDALVSSSGHHMYGGVSGYGGSRSLMIADDELANDLNMLNLSVEGHRGRGEGGSTARSRSSSRTPFDVTRNAAARSQPASLPIYGLPTQHRQNVDQPSTPTNGSELLGHLGSGSTGLQPHAHPIRNSPVVSGDLRGRLSVSPNAPSGRGASPSRTFRNGQAPSPTSSGMIGSALQHDGGSSGQHQFDIQGNSQNPPHLSYTSSAASNSTLNGSQLRVHGPPSPLAYPQTQNALATGSQQRLTPLSVSSFPGIQGGGAVPSSPISNSASNANAPSQFNGQSRGVGGNMYSYGLTPLTSSTATGQGALNPLPTYTRSLSLGSVGGGGGSSGSLHAFPTSSSPGVPYTQVPQLSGHGRSPSDQYPSTSATGAPLTELGRGVPLHLIASSTLLFIVEFKAGRTDLFFCPDPTLSLEVQRGDLVIVEADRGKDLGKVINAGITGEEVERFQRHQLQLQSQSQGMHGGVGDVDEGPVSPSGGPASPVKPFTKEIMPKRIYAKASLQDVQLFESKLQDEAKALQLCQTKVRAKKLPMEVIEAEYQWDRRKLTFYFVAERRIDFRELVRELFRLYKTRIWMACLQGPTSIESMSS